MGLAKVRLDKGKDGRVEYGLRHVMSSPEVRAVLAECKKKREKEAALGVKDDTYASLFMLPTVLHDKICAEHKIKGSDYEQLNRIVERDYPAFKTTNSRIG